MALRLICVTVAVTLGWAVPAAAQSAPAVVDDDGRAVLDNCSSATPSFSTIQSAVTAAAAGGIVEVCPGTYPELVNVNKSLRLYGNQSLIDARDGRPGAAETIVTGADAGGGTRTTSFLVNADDVSIDGFTIQGGTNAAQLGAAIVLYPGTSGTGVHNNIIENSTAGVFLANDDVFNGTAIRGNLFRNNDAAGPASGSGIYSDQFVAGGDLAGVEIDENRFESHDGSGAAINLSSTDPGSQSNITMRRNTFDSNSRALQAINLTHSFFGHNEATGSNLSGGAELSLFEGSFHIVFRENLLDGGGANMRGVRVSNSGSGAPPAEELFFDCNSITGYASAGLQVDPGSYTGVLDAQGAAALAPPNWWGSALGPTNAANGFSPIGTGDEIIAPAGSVDFTPWLINGTDTAPDATGFQCKPNPTCFGLPLTGGPTTGADVIQTARQWDRVDSRKGADAVCTSDGSDAAHGGDGNDRVDGEDGSDALFGDSNNDKLFGGRGGDRLDGGAGTDRCDGGPGFDTGHSCETRISIERVE